MPCSRASTRPSSGGCCSTTLPSCSALRCRSRPDMADVMQARGRFRAASHLPSWEVMDKAGIFREVGLELVDFSFCNDPMEAEGALMDGTIDFVSGNHI